MSRASSWLFAGLVGVGGLALAAHEAHAQFGRGGGGIGVGGGGIGRGGGFGGGSGFGIGVGPGGISFGTGGYNRGGFGLGNSGYGNFGFNNNYGYGNYGRPGFNNYGWGNYGNRYYGGTGYYSGYGPSYYGNSGYYSGYGPTYGNTYVDPGYNYSAPQADFSAAAPAQPEASSPNQARVHVIVPDPDAQVWFEGRKTNSSGTTRDFVTPELEPNSDYHYTITAAMDDNGRVVTKERRVNVRAGADVIVDFTRPAAGAGNAPVGNAPVGNAPVGNAPGANVDPGIRGGTGNPAGDLRREDQRPVDRNPSDRNPAPRENPR